MIADKVLTELEKYANPNDAVFLQRFFKTGEGEYGAGDVFIGVRMPENRKVAAKFRDLDLKDLHEILASPIHEMRMCGAIIISQQAKRAKPEQLQQLAEFYLSESSQINNWDIVDISCRDVVGQYVLTNPDKMQVLTKLAKSKNIWERRIAMISTWQFIRKGKLDPTYKIAEMLLDDKHDLMHKAVGWMLREAGKKDPDRLMKFLQDNHTRLPRTTLRYAIEKFEPAIRQQFLKGEF